MPVQMVCNIKSIWRNVSVWPNVIIWAAVALYSISAIVVQHSCIYVHVHVL